nr:MAG TPA: hypothetical protein [Bacteriophage sp.]
MFQIGVYYNYRKGSGKPTNRRKVDKYEKVH